MRHFLYICVFIQPSYIPTFKTKLDISAFKPSEAESKHLWIGILVNVSRLRHYAAALCQRDLVSFFIR